jgi:hypothetical protein
MRGRERHTASLRWCSRRVSRKDACVYAVAYYLSSLCRRYDRTLLQHIMKFCCSVVVSCALLLGLPAAQGYTNQSEIPLYGLSPPVYPSRTFPEIPQSFHDQVVYNTVAASSPLAIFPMLHVFLTSRHRLHSRFYMFGWLIIFQHVVMAQPLRFGRLHTLVQEVS